MDCILPLLGSSSFKVFLAFFLGSSSIFFLGFLFVLKVGYLAGEYGSWSKLSRQSGSTSLVEVMEDKASSRAVIVEWTLRRFEDRCVRRKNELV